MLPGSVTEIAAESAEQQPYKADNPNHARKVLKHGSMFMLLDDVGFMPRGSRLGFGLYRDDTRWLNQWDIRLNGEPLLPLNGTVDDGFAGVFDYANSRQSDGLAEMTIFVRRELVITDVLTERITVSNYHDKVLPITLQITFGNDFADMFEVRGQQRARRGQMLPPKTAKRSMRLGYQGLDDVLRETTVSFRGAVPTLQPGEASFQMTLQPRQTKHIEVTIAPRLNGKPLHARRTHLYDSELKIATDTWETWRQNSTGVKTENERFNAVIRRALHDIYLLHQSSPRGRALAAGVPWFAVPFGRDSAITALQTSPFFIDLMRDVIRLLASYQGRKTDPVTAEKPGRIMHELRIGEMARLAEIAFRPYFGTVDATQLWLMLLHEYVMWTGDLELPRELWRNVRAAISFLRKESAEKYITYGGTGALTNQGWKDSGNSIVYSDGSQAKAPIALCEAQGYLYSAYLGVANIATHLGHKRFAKQLTTLASDLRTNFQKDFWMTDKGFVALALDGEGRHCDVISSNPGHLLSTGILSREQEQAVVDRLMQDDMFCGWGIRTLASSERAYQPMDYQRGSVWPHDNGMAIEGFCRVGRADAAHEVMRGLFEVAVRQPDLRLPELFAGFEKEGGVLPTRYPVACVPQAWAAGAVFHMLKACFNIVPDAPNHTLVLAKPSVPLWLGKVELTGLKFADSVFDLTFTPTPHGTDVSVRRLSGSASWRVEG